MGLKPEKSYTIKVLFHLLNFQNMDMMNFGLERITLESLPPITTVPFMEWLLLC